jgi:hypothetical protein
MLEEIDNAVDLSIFDGLSHIASMAVLSADDGREPGDVVGTESRVLAIALSKIAMN